MTPSPSLLDYGLRQLGDAEQQIAELLSSRDLVADPARLRESLMQLADTVTDARCAVQDHHKIPRTA